MIRRVFFRTTGMQLGLSALASLLDRELQSAPIIAPKAKRVISLFMHGGLRNWICLMINRSYVNVTAKNYPHPCAVTSG